MVKLKIVVRDGAYWLRISENRERCYKSLKSFIEGSPKLGHFDSRRGLFKTGTQAARLNNKRLGELVREFEQIVQLHPDYTYKQVAARFENKRLEEQMAPVLPKTESSPDRIDAYITTIIEREKQKSGCNFELYYKLQKKMRKIFIDFEDWEFSSLNYDRCAVIANTLLKYPGYKSTVKSLRNALGKASKDRTIKFNITQLEGFSFNDLIPDRDEDDLHAPDVLTQEQVLKFSTMPAEELNPEDTRHKCDGLYRDFCLFMLHSFMAPCDVVKLKASNITGKHTLLIKRKKTHRRVEVPISPAMEIIIARYRGQSPYGYIFPIMDDEREAKSRTRDYIYKRWREDLAVWLKGVGRTLGTSFPLYPYVFRHSAITIALDNGLPLAFVAAVAGTSIDMIQKHYYNADGLQNRERLQAVFSGVSGGLPAFPG